MLISNELPNKPENVFPTPKIKRENNIRIADHELDRCSFNQFLTYDDRLSIKLAENKLHINPISSKPIYRGFRRGQQRDQ